MISLPSGVSTKAKKSHSITQCEIIQSNFFQILAYVENQNAENQLMDGRDYPQERSLNTKGLLLHIF